MESSYNHSEEVDKVDDMISNANRNSDMNKSYNFDNETRSNILN